ncbi:MAG: apolipoprotein N-acyltransferase [Opitutae bacterium]|nr:apolipoprotein N-acyltransferase [Opitutae bacterium]
MAATHVEPDPYAPRPTLWQRRPHLGWVLAVFGFTVFLTYISFPPVNTGEAAYVLALPGILWAYRRPALRMYVWTVLGAQMVAWTALLGWLHNVTWGGLLLLGPFVGLLVGSWFLAVWWTIPRLQGHKALVRIFAMLGLAALWVVLEWFRGVIFGGFPWLPLAASQWQRPLVLQVAAYAGAGATSFVLVVFNLGAGAYVHRAFFEGVTGFKKRTPEFSVALLVLMGGSFPFLADSFNQQRRPLARVALVQPYIPQNEKWDAAHASEVLRTLENLTYTASHRGAPELILWPEAVTPWALYKDANVQPWLESVAKRTGKPILLGTVAAQQLSWPDWHWTNAAVVVSPADGLQAATYAKRKLVPFGEFVPLRPVLGWIEKFAPIGGDFQRGSDAAPLLVPVNFGPTLNGRMVSVRQVPVGVLICFEDIFPALARESVRAGAEVLAVLTNNGWFGEGGAAYQHAAHSVLRAIETRRPVIRCGNGGWSGWIDEFGSIRATMENDAGSVYFRGAQTVAVTRDIRWAGKLSYYTQHGDWFLLVCVALAAGAYYTVLMLRPPRPEPDASKRF